MRPVLRKGRIYLATKESSVAKGNLPHFTNTHISLEEKVTVVRDRPETCGLDSIKRYSNFQFYCRRSPSDLRCSCCCTLRTGEGGGRKRVICLRLLSRDFSPPREIAGKWDKLYLLCTGNNNPPERERSQRNLPSSYCLAFMTDGLRGVGKQVVGGGFSILYFLGKDFYFLLD